MNSTLRYLPDNKNVLPDDYDASPFRPRKFPLTDHDSPEKKPARKGVKIMDPHLEKQPHGPDRASDTGGGLRVPHEAGEPLPAMHGILREGSQFDNHRHASEPSFNTARRPSTVLAFTQLDADSAKADKTLMSQWTLNQFHYNSLNPSVSATEADEYEAYINHPQNLGLVVSSAQVQSAPWSRHSDFVEYINAGNTIVAGGGGATGGGDAGGDGGSRAWEVSEEDKADFAEFLEVAENPLTVSEEDGEKKRYKRYGQWLRGKSLFKQSKVDPEYQAGGV